MTDREGPIEEATPVAATSSIGAREILVAFVALLVLTGTSYGLSFVHLGAYAAPVALGIAAVKVLVVALYFMGLLDEPPSHRLAAVAAAFFVILLVVFTRADVVTRQ
ncbi:MAG TPA: cytochrome C oxidase subunit IV family protein [Polyangiaceae bacterium]|nr:cytochrome C oxidase subunit IV family protein [Polyangiaceae bacterium]